MVTCLIAEVGTCKDEVCDMFYIYRCFHVSLNLGAQPCNKVKRAAGTSRGQSRAPVWKVLDLSLKVLVSPSTRLLSKTRGLVVSPFLVYLPITSLYGQYRQKGTGCQNCLAATHSNIPCHEVMSLQPKIPDTGPSKQTLCILTSSLSTQLCWKEKLAG